MIFPQEEYPLTIPGLIAWYDLSRTSLGSLATIPDFSGRNNNLTQGTGSKQPVNTANIYNGKSAAVFDASSVQSINGNYSATFTDWCFVIFYRITDLNEGVTVQITDGPAGGANRIVLVKNTDDNLVIAGQELVAVDTNPHIQFVFKGASSGRFYQDGTQYSSTLNLTSGCSGFTLGTRYDGATAPASLELFEFIVFSRQISSNEQDRVQKYLSNKWGHALD